MHALHVRFTYWYISLPSSAKLKQQRQREMIKVGNGLWRLYYMRINISFSLQTLTQFIQVSFWLTVTYFELRPKRLVPKTSALDHFCLQGAFASLVNSKQQFADKWRGAPCHFKAIIPCTHISIIARYLMSVTINVASCLTASVVRAFDLLYHCITSKTLYHMELFKFTRYIAAALVDECESISWAVMCQAVFFLAVVSKLCP